MMTVTYHRDGTASYHRDGVEITKAEYDKWSRKRRALSGGIEAILGAGRFGVDTDEDHVRINRSGLLPHEKEMIARRAKKLGLPEESAWDPTIPGQTVYGSRAQKKRQIAEDKAAAAAQGDTPNHRINPRHLPMLRKRAVAQDPSLARVSQRELDNEIVRRHAPDV